MVWSTSKCWNCQAEDVFKVVIVGDPAVGKTTLSAVLQRAFVLAESPALGPGSSSHQNTSSWSLADLEQYTPTVMDNWCATVRGFPPIPREPREHEREAVTAEPSEGSAGDSADPLLHVFLLDTAGGEYYDRLMPLSYPMTSLFLICFDVSNGVSLRTAEEKWFPEVMHHCPEADVLLVGLKRDLRGTVREDLVWNYMDSTQHVPKECSFQSAVETAKRIGALSYVECTVRRPLRADHGEATEISAAAPGIEALRDEIIAISNAPFRTTERRGACVMQ
jgi:small GTP-binding protein